MATQQQEFSYSPVNSGVSTQPVIGYSSTNYFSRKSKAVSDVEDILGAVGQVSKTIKEVQLIDAENKKQEDKDMFLRASNAFREKRAEYIAGLDKVQGNAVAYEQYMNDFRTTTENLSSNLSPEYKDTFLSSSENFLMYQGFNVEEQQQRENKDRYKEELTATADLVHGMEITQASTVIKDVISKAEGFGVTKKKAEEDFLDAKVNAMLVRLNTDTEINYGTLSGMNKEVNDLLSIMPNVKNSDKHVEILGKFKTLRNGLDSELESKVGYAISAGDYNMFTSLNKQALSVGAIDKDKYIMNSKKWLKSNYDADAAAAKVAAQLFTTTNGNISLDAYEGKIDSKIFSKVKAQVNDKIINLLNEGKNIGEITYHRTNNPDLFDKAFNKKVENDILKSMAIRDSGTATPEQVQQVEAIMNYNKQLMDRFPSSVKEETAKTLAQVTSLLNNPAIANVSNTFANLSSIDFKNISIDSKEFREASEGLSDADKASALRDYNAYTANNLSLKDKKNIIQETYKKIELKGTDIVMTKKANDLLGVEENSHELLIPAIVQALNEGGVTEKATKINNLADKEGTTLQTDNKGNLIFANGLEQELLLMDSDKKKVITDTIKNMKGEDKPNIITLGADYLLRDTLIDKVGGDYLVGYSGEVFFGAIGDVVDATTAVGSKVKQDSIEYWDLVKRSADNWNTKMIKDFNNYVEQENVKKQKKK